MSISNKDARDGACEELTTYWGLKEDLSTTEGGPSDPNPHVDEQVKEAHRLFKEAATDTSSAKAKELKEATDKLKQLRGGSA